MAGRIRRRAAALIALLIMGMARLSAEEPGEFFFEILPDGAPRFTQVFRWDADPDVLFYEVTVRTAADKEVSVKRVQEPLIRLTLPPGEYKVRIVLYNLLGKPEVELPWKNFTVKKAEVPRVTGVSPNAVFIEDLEADVRIAGENLVPGAEIVLKKTSGVPLTIPGTERGRSGTGSVNMLFALDSAVPGDYSIQVTNPGGLTVTFVNAVTVRYARAVDFLASAGYAPWIPLYDDWHRTHWPDPAFPLGAGAEFTVFFLKTEFGYLGARLEVEGRFFSGGEAGAAIDTLIGLAELKAVYKFRFNRTFSALAGVGGGVALSRHAFMYGATPGPTLTSADPCMSAGASAQFYFYKNLYLEAGLEWYHLFALDFSAGGLEPFIRAGFQF